MKPQIHPKLHLINVSCSCGAAFTILSTRSDDLKVEYCKHCHHVFTGKTQTIRVKGNVEKFQERYKGLSF